VQNTERVHRLFQGASEWAKILVRSAAVAEIGGAIVAVVSILWANEPKPLVPLLILVLAVIAMALRTWSQVIKGYANKCRAMSRRAFAYDIDLSTRALSHAEDDAPFLCDRFARKLPTSTLEAYYEPTCVVGEPRLRELYAHSAFYTWSLLRIYALVAFIAGAVIFSAAFFCVYLLASHMLTLSDNQPVLEIVLTIAVAFFGIRSIEIGLNSHSCSKTVRDIEDQLATLPVGDELLRLAERYDIETTYGPSAPTLIYKLQRNALQRDWHARRSIYQV
jgi:hypothetical protein